MATRELNKLHPQAVTAVKKPLPPGKHADGGGLYLVVDKPDPNTGAPGARRWLMFYQWAGKRRELGLGSFKSVSLDRARELAAEVRAQVANGVDPKTAREEVRAEALKEPEAVFTFGAFALEVLETRKQDWHGGKTEPRWLNGINNHCKLIKNKPIGDIETADVLACLNPIWRKIPEAAQKTQGMMAKVLDAAIAKGLYKGPNPARWPGHLAELMPSRVKLTKGAHEALEADSVPSLIQNLRGRSGAGARALELLILTGSRSAEVRDAPWSEFDLNNQLWSIPRERVKERRAMERARVLVKRVPLSAQAVDLLQRWRGELETAGLYDPAGPAFPGLSVTGMSDLVERLELPATVHGMRSTFRDWSGDQRITLPSGKKVPAFSWECCEIALGHVVGDATTRAYRRGDLLDERIDLLTEWGRYCAGLPIEREEVDTSALLAAFLADAGGDLAERWGAFLKGRKSGPVPAAA